MRHCVRARELGCWTARRKGPALARPKGARETEPRIDDSSVEHLTLLPTLLSSIFFLILGAIYSRGVLLFCGTNHQTSITKLPRLYHIRPRIQLSGGLGGVLIRFGNYLTCYGTRFVNASRKVLASANLRRCRPALHLRHSQCTPPSDAVCLLLPPGEKSVRGFQTLHVTHHFSVTPFITRILFMMPLAYLFEAASLAFLVASSISACGLPAICSLTMF